MRTVFDDEEDVVRERLKEDEGREEGPRGRPRAAQEVHGPPHPARPRPQRGRRPETRPREEALRQRGSA